MAKWQLNNGYEAIARALVEKFQELRHIKVGEIIFVDNLEAGKAATTSGRPRRSTAANPNRKPNSRVVYAQIRKIPRLYASIMNMRFNADYQFVMEVLKLNTMEFSREKLLFAIYHELRHIDQSGALLKHEIEDWANMTATIGANWGATQRQLPNLLAPDFDWAQFEGAQQKLFVVGGQAAAAGEGR